MKYHYKFNELIYIYRSRNPDHCLFIFKQASTSIARKCPTIYRVLGFYDFVNFVWQTPTTTLLHHFRISLAVIVLSLN